MKVDVSFTIAESVGNSVGGEMRLCRKVQRAVKDGAATVTVTVVKGSTIKPVLVSLDASWSLPDAYENRREWETADEASENEYRSILNSLNPSGAQEESFEFTGGDFISIEESLDEVLAPRLGELSAAQPAMSLSVNGVFEIPDGLRPWFAAELSIDGVSQRWKGTLS